MRGSKKEYIGGAAMLLLGISAMAIGKTYSVGTLRQMGPGFFPVALGGILAIVGLAIGAGGRMAAAQDREAALSPEWRGWICIIVSIITFVVLGRYGGLVPATFAIVFISALGDRQNTLMGSLILSAAIVLVCVVVFWWALQMQFPLFAWD